MLQSFAPVINDRSRVLVLGTMPGDASQRQSQYYAHARNAFWPIMASILAFDIKADYEDRLKALLDGGVGLWDVYQQCERQGSLDSAICQETAQMSDVAQLLEVYPNVSCLAFNGKLAYQVFCRHQLSKLPEGRVHWLSLPSTSPANAAMRFDQKLSAWQQLKDVLDA